MVMLLILTSAALDVYIVYVVVLLACLVFIDAAMLSWS